MKSLRSVAIGALVLGVLSAALAWKADGPIGGPTKVIAPLAEAGPKYWKGNLHTHSLWSDGDDFPEMIADWYKRNGYHFLSLTDHNLLPEGQRWIDAKKRATALEKYLDRFGPAWVEQRTVDDAKQVRLKPLAEYRTVLEEPGRFLMLSGEEITHKFAKLPIHLNGINVRDVVVPVDGDSVSETIRANIRSVADQQKRTKTDMLAFLNHPNYGWAVTADDLIQAEELRFFEIYNGHPGVKNYGDATRPGAERMWDIALAVRLGKHRYPLVHGVATDDAHQYHKFGVGSVNPGRGWIMVKAPFLSPEALVRAIHAGDFYSSTGVTLDDVRREGEQLSLRIRGEKGVTYKTQFIATLREAPLNARVEGDVKIYSDEIGKIVAESESLTPSYRLTGKELYLRARITSSKLHPNPYRADDVEVAWTQPIVP